MNEKKYNFTILFKKLKQARKEQEQIANLDFIVSSEIKEQIRQLKEYYDASSQELETYTRS
ncbi:MAG: hypothetical protein V2I62_03890 [Bacteroidales bacterium]|jgi:hypothetical protein|nr:hypothetical protein [Bacteroidales bacterium]